MRKTMNRKILEISVQNEFKKRRRRKKDRKKKKLPKVRRIVEGIRISVERIKMKMCNLISNNNNSNNKQINISLFNKHFIIHTMTSLLFSTLILKTVPITSFQMPLAPTRQVPPDTIVLDNGSTTYPSTLDEYLLTSKQTTPLLEQSNNYSTALFADSKPSNNNNQPSLSNNTPDRHDRLKPHHSQLAKEISNSKLVIKLFDLEREDSPQLSTTMTTTTTSTNIQYKNNASALIEQFKNTNLTRTTTILHEEEGAKKDEIKLDSKTQIETGNITHSSASMQKHGHNQESAIVNGTAAAKPILQHWQVKSLLNVTQDYPLAYSQIICGYVWPLMALITCFTNLMIVFVLTQKDMRTPTNVVLTAIAIADIIPIVVPVPWFVYLFAMGNEKQVLYPPVVCYFYQHSTRSVSEIFYFLSTWLNVLLAVQDYLTACRPKLAKRWCQINVVIWEILLLTLLAFSLNLPQALKLVFKPIKFYYQGELTWGCRALQAKWFKDLVGEYVALYDDIFTAVIVLFVDGGPAIALITLSALLIRQLHKQRIKGHKLMEQARTASKRRLERYRQQEYESSARVMIFVLLAFLAVKIPFATTYTLMIIQSRFEIHIVENLVDFQKAISITDLVFVLSYPINFTIFCCCSKKFRHKCIQLFGECNQNTKQARDRFMGSFSGSFQYTNTADGGSILSKLSRRTSAQTIARNGSMASSTIQLNNSNNNNSSSTAMLCDNKNNLSYEKDHILTRSLATIKGSTVNNSTNTFTESIVDSLDGARRSSLICDGRNHLIDIENLMMAAKQTAKLQEINNLTKLQQQQALLMPTEFRAQLEDGSLCLECIMRYEQIRRLSERSMESATAAAAAATAAAAVAASTSSSTSIAPSQLQTQLRRQSNDSLGSWPTAVPPPPPAPLSPSYIAQYKQLPYIITTRCESIREQDSGSELADPSSGSENSGSKSREDCENTTEVGRQHKEPGGEQVRHRHQHEHSGEQPQNSLGPGSVTIVSSHRGIRHDNNSRACDTNRSADARHSTDADEGSKFREILSAIQTTEPDMTNNSTMASNVAKSVKRQRQIDEATLRLTKLLNDDNNGSTLLRGNSDPGNSGSMLASIRDNLSMFIRRASGNSWTSAATTSTVGAYDNNQHQASDKKEEEAEEEEEEEERRTTAKQYSEEANSSKIGEANKPTSASGEVGRAGLSMGSEHENNRKLQRHQRESETSNYKKHSKQHRLSSISEPSKGNSRKSLKEEEARKSKGSLLETHQRRSLSMSESKLTTLPNATGLLADIMLNTLLGSTSQARMSTTEPDYDSAASTSLNSGSKKDKVREKKTKKSDKKSKEKKANKDNLLELSATKQQQRQHESSTEALAASENLLS